MRLSPRQAEVLDLVERGASLAEIAAKLGISRNTIKRRAHALCAKLGPGPALDCVWRARFDQALREAAEAWSRPADA